MNDPMRSRNALAENLATLRKRSRLSLEEVAERIGVTRQAVAKWESGASAPDVANCDALASLYDVTLDDLVRFKQDELGTGVPPRNKHIFGTVCIGERGQIVLPKKARDTLGLQCGDMLVVLGDTTPGSEGIALVPSGSFMDAAAQMMDALAKESEK